MQENVTDNWFRSCGHGSPNTALVADISHVCWHSQFSRMIWKAVGLKNASVLFKKILFIWFMKNGKLVILGENKTTLRLRRFELKYTT